MDNLFVLVIRTRLCNKLYEEGLDLPHCRCIETRQLQVRPPAICLLQDLKLTISLFGRDRERALWCGLLTLGLSGTLVARHDSCAGTSPKENEHLPAGNLFSGQMEGVTYHQA